jgi:hypothetical protein
MQEAATGPSQMTMDHAFAPGEPVGPYDGYSRTPRQFDFTTGYNIATRPRSHERVSFDTLRGLIESYDVASLCIWHRIDSIRSLDWKLIAAEGYAGDVTDAVATGMAALKKPDRIHDFGTWFAMWAFDVLAYDAGCLSRMRNRAGRVVGLEPVDGTSVAPLLDYWGRPPEAPAEAFVQYMNGLPWNWLTRDDLIYEPFRPRTNSPYGHAPLEMILLNANTDIRFQLYFLQRFTEGSVPEAFASAPESWSPDQIEQFQELWDSVMMGDQSRKHQIRWMPGGSTIAWSNEKEFSDVFSLHMMRKSCAAYHVVPTDMGFTENSNYSTGESQADVGHRVGDLPFGRHVERIITGFLQNDLGLPVKHQFDWGEEQDDRVAQAQADDIYTKIGVIGPSELREMRFGLAEPGGKPVPRFIYTTRAGPIPLSSLLDVAGPVDEATGAPVPGSPLPHKEFLPVEGVVPVPPPHAPALAERIYGPEAIPPAPPTAATAQPVVKEGDGGAAGGTIGITSETGITSYDLVGHDEDDEDEERAELAKSELAAFRRFERARRKAGTWRDFTFEAVDSGTARRLNAEGRQSVTKGVMPGPKVGEVRKATLDLRNLTGIWAKIYARRERLLRKHLKAVRAAWDVCVAELDPRDMVRGFREDVGLVAKAADPVKQWWKDSATGAAVAWLSQIDTTSGYPALVAAIESAISEGMAEGEADALAVAADRQGATGFVIAGAFSAALAKTQADPGVSQQAQESAGKMTAGAANDVGRTLAAMAADGSSEAGMSSAVEDETSGSQSRAVAAGTDWALSAAILAGAAGLFAQAGAGQSASVLVNWVTAGDARVCATCSGYEDNSPYTPEDVPDYPHPLCRCSTEPASDIPSSFFAAFLS